MKSIIMGILCGALFTSSPIYSLTRADTLLANSLKKQIEGFIKTKPAGWQDKAKVLVNQLETSLVPKGYDSTVVDNLKKEISPVVVVPQEVIQPQTIQPQIIKPEVIKVQDKPSVDKNAVAKQLDKQLTLPVDNAWHDKVDNLLFELSTVDRALASEYSQKVREKTISSVKKTTTPKVKTPVVSPVASIKNEPKLTPVVSEPKLTSVAKVSPQKSKPIKSKQAGAISLFDKDDLIKKLEEQLMLPVDNEWNKYVDDLLFDLATVDRTMARNYSQKIREKIISIPVKVVEPIKAEPVKVEPVKPKPIIEKPIVIKQQEPKKEVPVQEKVADKTEVSIPLSDEPMIKSTKPGPGSGRRPIAVKQQETVVSSVMPVKKEDVVHVQPKSSQRNATVVEEELKELIKEPTDQRAKDWLQNINDLIFELSVFDAKKAGMYLEEIYSLKTKSTTTATVVAQKEPERPTVFGGANKAPFLGNVKGKTDKVILDTFNKYLNVLLDYWVKGADGGRPATWWSTDTKVYANAINTKRLEVRTPEEIEKEFAVKTTKEAMAKEIQLEKDKMIVALRAQIDKEAKEARQGKMPVEISDITKAFNKKKEEAIAKIKEAPVDEGEIKERIRAAVTTFSPENVMQKIEAKVARVRAENQAAEKGFTLDELEGLTNELTEEIRAKNPNSSDKQIQQMVDRQLPEAKKVLLDDKERELQDLTKQLSEEIKKGNSQLSDREVIAEVKKRLPEAKKELEAKKKAEQQALMQQVTADIKKNNSSSSDEVINKLVKEKLQQIKKEDRAKKAEQRIKEVAEKERDELVQRLEKFFDEKAPKGTSTWVIGTKGAIKDLHKLDAQKAKEYRAKFLEEMPTEKLDL